MELILKAELLLKLRVDNSNITTADIRSSFSKLNLGDINVKEFGKVKIFLLKLKLKLKRIKI